MKSSLRAPRKRILQITLIGQVLGNSTPHAVDHGGHIAKVIRIMLAPIVDFFVHMTLGQSIMLISRCITLTWLSQK